jgi:hypothetical protein
MASQAIAGLRPVALATKVPGGIARGHSHRCRLRRPPVSSSTFLRPLAPDPLQALQRSYGRSDSCPPRRVTGGFTTIHSVGKQVSLIHALGLPAIPSPTTRACSASSRQGTLPHRGVGPRLLPRYRAVPWGNSGLRLSLAGSPPRTGRIEFSFLSSGRDFLRTGRSPPAALHPVSRRRSCSRLQVTLTWRGLSPLRPSALSGARVRQRSCRLGGRKRASGQRCAAWRTKAGASSRTPWRFAR